MIASRQKGRSSSRRTSSRQTNNTSSTSSTRDLNQVSNVDRSIATSRAKRNAALRARRGLSTSRKASAMEIEKEVQKQGKQTLLSKAKSAQQQKKRLTINSRLSPDEKAEIRQERRKLARAAAKAKREELATSRGGAHVNNNNKKANALGISSKIAETAPLGRPPSKKAVRAAMTAMEDKGFKVPDGYQMVISFAPSNTGTMTMDGPVNNKGKKNPPNYNNNNNNSSTRSRRGGRN